MDVIIKGHKSSIVTCEINSTSLYVISGSADLRVHVSSCYKPEIDVPFLSDEQKTSAQPMGTILCEFKEKIAGLILLLGCLMVFWD